MEYALMSGTLPWLHDHGHHLVVALLQRREVELQLAVVARIVAGHLVHVPDEHNVTQTHRQTGKYVRSGQVRLVRAGSGRAFR